jgi:hypothetical protein
MARDSDGRRTSCEVASSSAGLEFNARYLKHGTCDTTNTCLTPSGMAASYGLVNTTRQVDTCMPSACLPRPAAAHRHAQQLTALVPCHTAHRSDSSGAAFHRFNTLVRSSHLDRTLSSALSFTAGVFPLDSSEATATRWLPNGQQVRAAMRAQSSSPPAPQSHPRPRPPPAQTPPVLHRPVLAAAPPAPPTPHLPPRASQRAQASPAVAARSCPWGLYPTSTWTPPAAPWPALQVVPVYSQPAEDDYLIRGFTRCNAYSARLTAWYGSPEFAAKVQETQATRCAAPPPGTAAPG